MTRWKKSPILRESYICIHDNRAAVMPINRTDYSTKNVGVKGNRKKDKLMAITKMCEENWSNVRERIHDLQEKSSDDEFKRKKKVTKSFL